MAKTTKIARGIHSWIKFQRHQGLQSLTIKGKDSLADLSQDKNGDTDLILNADKDKINSISSAIPFISVSERNEGADPNKQKVASLDYDLTSLDVAGDEYLTVTKEPKRLSLSSVKLLEKVTEMLNAIKVASGVTEEKVKQIFTENFETGVTTGFIRNVSSDEATHSFDLKSIAPSITPAFIFNSQDQGFIQIDYVQDEAVTDIGGKTVGYTPKSIETVITKELEDNKCNIVFDNLVCVLYIKNDELFIKTKGRISPNTIGEHAHLYIKIYGGGIPKSYFIPSPVDNDENISFPQLHVRPQ